MTSAWAIARLTDCWCPYFDLNIRQTLQQQIYIYIFIYLMLRESWVICKRFLHPKGSPRIRDSVFHHANSLDFWLHRQGGPAQKLGSNESLKEATVWLCFYRGYDMLIPWRYSLLAFMLFYYCCFFTFTYIGCPASILKPFPKVYCRIM